ncbi:non-ribosomal peptide synthetase, partial [Bacillus thuringiensis]|uniref:non-ribosomal peptide synthetase n=1 Tax=Bacillus thuringiensis TaxID=1428 RepID=UPI003A85CCEB
SVTPLFQTMFLFHRDSLTLNKVHDLNISSREVRKKFTKFDISFSIDESNGKLACECQYNSNLFKEETIKKMMKHFRNLLLSIAETNKQSINYINIIDQEEVNQLKKWNNTKIEYPKDKCIHELFEAQVLKTPNSIAIEYEGERITYHLLNNLANKAANFLRKKGVCREDLIGIHMGRSINQVVAFLAVLKAGGTYVPLDPTYPEDRLNYMLKDCRPKMILTESFSKLKEVSDYTGDIFVIERSLYEEEDTTNLINITSPGDLAYIIYTSGSTGNPKGIMNTHEGVSNYLAFLKEEFNLGEQDRVLQLATFSADSFLRDLMGPLISGSKVILLPEDIVKDHDLLLNKVNNCGITCILSIVPTMLKVITEIAESNDISNDTIRLILVSGEFFKANIAKAARKIFSRAILVNLYGPTECTLTSTYHYVPLSEENSYIVGRPMQNKNIYILDEYLQTTPIGVSGNIYIGGVGIAKGYINNKELSRVSFIKDPFNNGSLLYKTGDIGRYLSNGLIELQGRNDRQVKIRGFRIELDEVESILESHLDVKSAVVIMKKDSEDNNFLIGYVVPLSQKNVNINELFNYVSEKVPSYMVPSHFIVTDFIPQTPNGKIDRKNLPDIDFSVNKMKCISNKNPRNEIEKYLVEIWSQILKRDDIGINNNFFELGGHSLLATKIISRIRNNFGINISLISIFEDQTIEKLAERISLLKGNVKEPAVKIPKISRDQYRLKF